MDSGVRITILSENTSEQEGLAAEYGLSMWIEVDGTKILFDTGMAGAFAANADKLGIDLSQTVHLVLSHGHFDHTGGVAAVIDRAPGVIVHMHPDAARPKYLSDGQGKTVPIGMPEPGLTALRDKTSRCLFLSWITRLTKHVSITGPIPRGSSFEKVMEHFVLDPEGAVPDTIEDDLALWIETREGLIVVLGCAHAGVVNTVDYIRKESGRDRIRAIIGGMHLMSSDQETIAKTADAIASWNPGLISPNHCTGEAACRYFQERFPGIYRPSGAGTVFEFA